MSSDWIVILLFLYVCHLFLEKSYKFSFNLIKLKFISGFILVILTINNFNLDKIINYKKNFYLNKINNDNTFLSR